jgi:hypothetical protein
VDSRGKHLCCLAKPMYDVEGLVSNWRGLQLVAKESEHGGELEHEEVRNWKKKFGHCVKQHPCLTLMSPVNRSVLILYSE